MLMMWPRLSFGGSGPRGAPGGAPGGPPGGAPGGAPDMLRAKRIGNGVADKIARRCIVLSGVRESWRTAV